MNRATLTKIHLLLAAFMFPVALMFLVTGGFYTWGIKGSYVSESHELTLSEPLAADLGQLSGIVVAELQQRDLALPSGEAKIKKGGTSYKLEWTGSARDVELEPTADPLLAKLTIKETTWYRNLVQLHKAKGGQLFKVYAAALAISLFAILASGFVLAWQVPKLKRTAMRFAGAGVLVFLVAVFAS